MDPRQITESLTVARTSRSARTLIAVLAIGCLSIALGLAGTDTALARSLYDGQWSLIFVTQVGACDPTYNFTVNINNGLVSHPNLVNFRSYVSRSGAVRASVTVHEKHAAGSGKLLSTSGRGNWRGYAGQERCSGYWTAQKN